MAESKDEAAEVEQLLTSEFAVAQLWQHLPVLCQEKSARIFGSSE